MDKQIPGLDKIEDTITFCPEHPSWSMLPLLFLSLSLSVFEIPAAFESNLPSRNHHCLFDSHGFGSIRIRFDRVRSDIEYMEGGRSEEEKGREREKSLSSFVRNGMIRGRGGREGGGEESSVFAVPTPMPGASTYRTDFSTAPSRHYRLRSSYRETRARRYDRARIALGSVSSTFVPRLFSRPLLLVLRTGERD